MKRDKGYKVYCNVCQEEHEFFPVGSGEGFVKLSATCVATDGNKKPTTYWYDTRKGTITENRGGRTVMRPKRKGVPTPRSLSRLESKSGKYFDGYETTPLLTMEPDRIWRTRVVAVLWQGSDGIEQRVEVTGKTQDGLCVHRQLVSGATGAFVFNKRKGLFTISHSGSGFSVLPGGAGYFKETDAIKCAEYLLLSGVDWRLPKEKLQAETNARDLISNILKGKVEDVSKPIYQKR